MRTSILSIALLLAAAASGFGQGSIYIRGLRYTNMTQGTSISPRTVAPGGVITITLPRTFGNVLRAEVTLEDANRPRNGGGITNFSLRQRRLSGNRIVARVPAQSLFANRSFNVAVFVFVNGVTRFYASAGRIRIATGGGAQPASSGSAASSLPPIYIRGLRYANMSRGTRLVQRRARPGDVITIRLPRRFGRVLRAEVVLEDVNRRRTGGGVTNFSLRQRRLSGNRITARIPNNSVFLDRTFHVAVFVFVDGQTRFYGSAGNLAIRRNVQPQGYTIPPGFRILRTPRQPVRLIRRQP